jgi:hypothetical protein
VLRRIAAYLREQAILLHLALDEREAMIAAEAERRAAIVGRRWIDLIEQGADPFAVKEELVAEQAALPYEDE